MSPGAIFTVVYDRMPSGVNKGYHLLREARLATRVRRGGTLKFIQRYVTPLSGTSQPHNCSRLRVPWFGVWCAGFKAEIRLSAMLTNRRNDTQGGIRRKTQMLWFSIPEILLGMSWVVVLLREKESRQAYAKQTKTEELRQER